MHGPCKGRVQGIKGACTGVHGVCTGHEWGKHEHAQGSMKNAREEALAVLDVALEGATKLRLRNVRADFTERESD